MKILKRIFAIGAILSIFNICLPTIAFADQAYLISAADKTIHEPEIITSKPATVQKAKEKKVPTWVWVVGLALVSGAIAIAGGGGNSGGGDSGSGGEGSGAVTIEW
jgi:hypothetical protein